MRELRREKSILCTWSLISWLEPELPGFHCQSSPCLLSQVKWTHYGQAAYGLKFLFLGLVQVLKVACDSRRGGSKYSLVRVLHQMSSHLFWFPLGTRASLQEFQCRWCLEATQPLATCWFLQGESCGQPLKGSLLHPLAVPSTHPLHRHWAPREFQLSYPLPVRSIRVLKPKSDYKDLHWVL